MANDRTNMVSLVDAGLWLGGKNSNIVEIGDGFTELTENWGPDKSSNQYINMKSKSSTLKGYEFSTTAEREHLNDDLQVIIDNGFKKFPTGKDCETFYYRYYKTDMSIAEDGSMSGDCIKLPVIMAPSSTGGAGGDVLTSSVEISGNGDVVLGTITISKDGEVSFVEKSKDATSTGGNDTEQNESNVPDSEKGENTESGDESGENTEAGPESGSVEEGTDSGSTEGETEQGDDGEDTGTTE